MRNTWIGLAGLLLLAVGAAGLAWWVLATPGTRGLGRPTTTRDALTRPGPFVTPYDDGYGMMRPFGRRGGTSPRFTTPDSTITLGASIYLYGVGEDGAVPRTAIGPGMMGGGCANCHGADGKGGTFSMMMGRFRAPDVRYSTLTSEHEEVNLEGETEMHEPWTEKEIRRSIVDGVEPDGKQLDVFMPRWRLSDRELDALLAYLKELSRT